MADYNFLEVPVAAPNQRFSIFLGATLVELQLRWNYYTEHWNIDIYDEDGNLLVAAIPLVTGVDLLQQHRHLQIGGGLIVQTDFDPLQAPSYDNLGNTSHLFFFQGVR